MNRLIHCTLLLLLICTFTFTTAGCANGQITIGQSTVTEDDVTSLIINNEASIKTGAQVTTTYILGTIDASKAREAAPTIKQVATMLNEAFASSGVKLTALRQVAKSYIDNLTVSQATKDIAYYAAVTVLNNLEFVIETQFNKATADDKLRATQVLLRAASAGVIESVDKLLAPPSAQPATTG